ncbi:MAG TPA: hypothetical protein VHO02_02225 [Fibrobacteria bacterium]|jgi:hypothetical protein|nr:hypothetical protein [Fibrobacteria bacterium]
MRKFTKHLIVAAASIAALALTACVGSADAPAGSAANDGYATVVVQTKTTAITQLSKPGLGKAAAITLDSLRIQAISNAVTPDTVYVRIKAPDSGFSSSATADQNVTVRLNLKALRSWTINVLTKDVRDSVVHNGTATVSNLVAGEVRATNLTATPNFTIYNTTFNLPDSISSPTGLTKQKLTFTRLQMYIGGTLRKDSLNTFTPSTNYVLTYDYVRAGADSVRLQVYGNITGANAIDPLTSTAWNTGSHLLYKNAVLISSLSAAPATNNVALAWQGPTTGKDSIVVTIQKVPQYNINGTTTAVVLSKK